MMMYIGNFLGGFIVLIFGLIVRFLKASWLVAGYNTAPKEEKAKYNEEKLTKFVGNMMIFASVILLIGGVLAVIASIKVQLIIVGISWVLFLLIIIGGVICMNIGSYVKK